MEEQKYYSQSLRVFKQCSGIATATHLGLSWELKYHLAKNVPLEIQLAFCLLNSPCL